MKTPIITATTDLGDGFATAQLRAVVASLGYEGQLFENHDVSDYEILEGAYGVWQLTKYCPPGTVHIGVVDPGVGSERAGIVIKTKNFWFVGPDNGLLWPAANEDGIENIWRIDESLFGQVATTFHGRDVFIKQAVYLAQGKDVFSRQSLAISQIVKLSFEEGQVLHIDKYGNAKVWGQNSFGLPVVKTFSDVPPGTPLVLAGSSDTQEIAVNLGSAKDYFGLKLGQVITELNHG